jgi:hypothetical protein
VSPRFCRRLARGIGRLLRPAYPARDSDWARAMQHEIDQLDDDGSALVFALGCLWGGCRRSASTALNALAGEMKMKKDLWTWLLVPRNAGLAGALAATCLGIFYLIVAGAPARYVVVNATAFLLGAVALSGLRGVAVPAARHAGAIVMALGLCLIVTGLVGARVDGASRWIWIGPLSVQVSFVLLPPMIVAYARQADALGTAGIAVAAAAMALQPDRAMAGVLALSLMALAWARPGRAAAASVIVALAAFAITLVRPDTLAAVAHVDQILFSAFEVHVLAGIAVLLGSALLLAPAAIGWSRDPAGRHVYLAFGATWLGCVLAAALGNYPTPVVGYGGSAILGYLLSLSIFPAHAGAIARSGHGAATGQPDHGEILPRALATHPAG